jgi:UPF0176 protein
LENPERIRDEQEEFCLNHGLRGRILVAREGINGTVSGPKEAIQAYLDWMGQHAILGGTEFKIEGSEGHTFLKLHVRVKEEIVHLGAGDLNIPQHPDNYIEPQEFREILANNPEDYIIFDARSKYETNVGRFKTAIDLDLDNFRDLPEKLKELEAYKDKPIITYCTGGIKCEKVSALMRDHGFDNVRQLHGGIIRYAAEAEGENFEGSCYVFDQRVVVPVNKVNPTVVGKCKLCEGPTETMVNCANPDCNDHFLICENCAEEMEGTCSETCKASPRRRAFDGRGYYLRGVNSKLFVNNPDPNYLRMLETGCVPE